MSNWKDKFGTLTKGGLMWEILAEKDGQWWGRLKSGDNGSWWPCVWRTDGKSGAGHSAYDLIPKRTPLRIEDVPLGFPCRLKGGQTFTPYWIDIAGDFWGREEADQTASCCPLSAIDPDSISETREVWLTVYPDQSIVICGGGYKSKSAAEANLQKGGFVYGPIRVPTKLIGS